MLLQSLLLTAFLAAAQVETTFTVQYGGKTYDFRITDADLQKTPAWAATQENPPLSARRAIDIASKQLAALLPNAKDWKLQDVRLQAIDNRWVYLVGFVEPLRPNVADQVTRGFQIVVLMSGVAVMPLVK